MLEDGRLHLSGIKELAPHLTEANCEAVLARATHMSKREIKVLVAELEPKPDVQSKIRELPQREKKQEQARQAARRSPSVEPTRSGPSCPPPPSTPARETQDPREEVEPLSPARYKVQFTASAGLRDKLERLAALMPETDLASMHEVAVTEKLERLEAKRYGRADDTIVFGMNNGSGLWRISADGGEPERLTTTESERVNHLWPEWLPNGEAILYTVIDGESAQVAVASLATGESKVLIPQGSNPRYAPTGHIVYSSSETLFAVGFDLERLEVAGEPVPVNRGVVTKHTGASDFALSRSGSLVYVHGSASDRSYTRVWVDRAGNETPISEDGSFWNQPRIAPDGGRLALSIFGQTSNVWIWDMARETLTRLTFGSLSDGEPRWSPDGTRIAFASRRGPGSGMFNLFWKAADGTGAVERLTESENPQFPEAFSPDGSLLVFSESDPETGSDLHVLSMDGEGKIEPLLASEFQESNAEISPDGRWIAFQSDESGQAEIYVRPFPDVDAGRWQISRGGGTAPRWSRDGTELFYVSEAGQLISVPIESDPFVPGNPEVILEAARTATVLNETRYDVSPDGERFLIFKENAPDEDAEPTELILVQNWLDELERLVPAHQ